jgi:hypothetical protein
MTPTWDILVPTFYARTPLFVQLLDQLERQVRPGVRVIAARGERDPARIGEKYQAMMDASEADYTSVCADDALLHREYVSLIHDAMRAGPDTVGFLLGLPHGVVQAHSIAFHGVPGLEWSEYRPDLFWGPHWCDLGTWMPVRRSIGSRVRFAVDDSDDLWTRGVWETGLLRTEVFIREVLVAPQAVDQGFHGRWDPEAPSPHPERDFVTYI